LMDTVNKLIIAFMGFSFAGWVWESIYCTILEKKWANRGFLYGPFCPIYGFGGVIGLIIYLMISRQILPQLSGQEIFLSGFLLSMILEYPTSWLLEKLFSARWWDYSNIPFNINGRTSIPTSIGFGAAAILVMNYLVPAVVSVLDRFPAWLTASGAMLSVAFLSADFTLTVSVLTNVQKYVTRVDDAFQNRMTDAVFRAFQAENRLYRRAVEGISVFKLPVSKAELANRLRDGKLAELIRERLGEFVEKKAEPQHETKEALNDGGERKEEKEK